MNKRRAAAFSSLRAGEAFVNLMASRTHD
jgi:hypothetical protein